MNKSTLSDIEKKKLLDSLVGNLRTVKRKKKEYQITEAEKQAAEHLLDSFSLEQ